MCCEGGIDHYQTNPAVLLYIFCVCGGGGVGLPTLARCVCGVGGRGVQSLPGKTGIEILACNYSQFIAALYTLACKSFAQNESLCRQGVRSGCHWMQNHRTCAHTIRCTRKLWVHNMQEVFKMHGNGRSQIIRRQEGLVLYKLFNTHWHRVWH